MKAICNTTLNLRGRELFKYIRFFEERRCTRCSGVCIGSTYVSVYGTRSNLHLVCKNLLGIDFNDIVSCEITSYKDGSTDLHLRIKA